MNWLTNGPQNHLNNPLPSERVQTSPHFPSSLVQPVPNPNSSVLARPS